MKTKYIKWGIIALVVFLVINLFVGTYNSLVKKNEAIDGKWADVETQYQRRADLVPNLVNTVKGYASHEQQTIIGAVEARAKSTQMTLNVDNLTPENLAQYEAAQKELSQGIGRLMAIGESYPTLSASANFQSLQDELAGTENRVTKARSDFNQAVRDYNSYLKRFPRNMLAGMYGFESRAYFEATAGAEVAPTVEF